MAYTKRNFTFKKFIAEPDAIEGTEGEISLHGGVPVPWDCVLDTRNLGVSSFSGGGALVGTKVQPDLISYARSKMICGQMGCTYLTGLTMPNAQPHALTPVTTQWLAEHQASTPSDISIANLSFAPCRVSATVPYSNLLRAQSALDFEETVKGEIVKALFLAADQAAILGTGGVMPIGVLNTVGTQTLTFSGPPTFSKLMSMPQAIKNQNLDIDASLGFAMSPDVEFALRTTPRGTGLSTYLMNDNGTVGGFRSISSTTLNASSANNRVLFLAWENLYIAWFGNSVWLTIDPFTNAKTGERSITAHCYIDAGLVRPQAAICSVDAGNQS
jgi:HK97 family phage major capsid protein